MSDISGNWTVKLGTYTQFDGLLDTKKQTYDGVAVTDYDGLSTAVAWTVVLNRQGTAYTLQFADGVESGNSIGGGSVEISPTPGTDTSDTWSADA